MDPEKAQLLAISSLQYIAGDEAVLSQFIALTGMTVDDLREMPKDEAFYSAILDFLLGHEPTLLAFAAHAQIDPINVQKAKYALSSHEHMEF